MSSSTRGISDARASQRALLKQLSQRRKDGGSPQKKRTIIGLTDSDDSDDEEHAGQGSVGDDSDYEDDVGAVPPFAPPSQALLLRLHKPGVVPQQQTSAD